MSRKWIYRIHLWLSIPLGILITVICLSGATLVFKDEIRSALGMPKVIPHAQQHQKLSADVSADSIAAYQKKVAKMKKAGMTDKPDFFTYMARLHKSLFAGKVGKCICPHRSGVRSASAATRRNDAPVPCHTCGQLGRNSHQNSHIHRVCGWCHTSPHRLLHLFQKTFVITHINTSFN